MRKEQNLSQNRKTFIELVTTGAEWIKRHFVRCQNTSRHGDLESESEFVFNVNGTKLSRDVGGSADPAM